MNLDTSAVGASWLAAAASAVDVPAIVGAPIEELLFFDPRQPSATAYRFPAKRGHRVSIEIESDIDQLFVDLFRIAESSEPSLVHVASRDSETGFLQFEPRRDADYLLRVQPELLRGGKVSVGIVVRASLAFPVDGAGPENIWSFFGDPRDAGARIHEGIDIFAPRGTPLLAASDSVVMRVSVRVRGGNVVFLYDEDRDLRLYYAHLEEQLVTQGQALRAGDIVGTVGNSGNAITTPTHLHLGLYRGGWGGAVDPWEFFVDPARVTPESIDHADMVGEWYRTDEPVVMTLGYNGTRTSRSISNRNPLVRPSTTAEPLTIEIPAGSALFVNGALGNRVRVRNSAGSWGFITPSALSHATEAVRLDSAKRVVDPSSGAEIGELPKGSLVDAMGDDSGDQLARLESGRVVWLR